MPTVMSLQDPAAIAAATHPLRAAILEAMREPATAASVARVVGQSRQNVAYHVRELERAGLVRRVGQRQNGNFVEQTFVAAAQTLVISPTVTWGDPERHTAALADQLSLGQLFATGERLQADSAALLDRAVFDGEEIPSASVVTDVRFPTEHARTEFLREYVSLVANLTRTYGARRGTPYRLILAAYPNPEGA